MRLNILITSLVFLPFLYFAIGNFESLSLAEFLVLLATPITILLICMIVLLITKFLFHRKVYRTLGLVIGIGIFMGFNYALLSLDKVLYLGLTLFLILFIPFLYFKFNEVRNTFENLIFVVISVCIIQLGYLQFTSFNQFDTKDDLKLYSSLYDYEIANNRNYPNIYIFILDAYSSDKELLHLGFDNSKISKELSEKGFQISKNSKANFLETFRSMYTFWSMQYPELEKSKPYFQRSSLVRIMNSENTTINSLKYLGYQHIKVGPNQSTYLDCSGIEDVCLFKLNNFDGTSGGISNNIFLQILKMTPLYNIAMSLFGLERDVYTKATLEKVKEELVSQRSKFNSPYLLSVNVWQPHAPYIYNSDCTKLDKPHSYDISWKTEMIPSYINSTKCVNKQLNELIDLIVKDDPDGIILIQSDHGHNFYLDGEPKFENWSDNEIESRASIYWAIRVPNRCKNIFYDGISPVNSMRLIFACLLDEPVSFLDDISYAHSLNKLNSEYKLIKD